MIDILVPTGKHIYAQTYPGTTYVNANMLSAGQLRFANGAMEVYDGNQWVRLYTGEGRIGLSDAASDAIDWAIAKMAEEKAIAELAAQSPTIADAVNKVNEATQQLKVLITLTKEA